LKNIVIDNEYPEILADRGGYYVKINGDILQEARQDYQLSLKDLADLAHVSRETIYKYEHGIVKACPETAMLLEDVLNLKITLDINLFDIPEADYSNPSFNKNTVDPKLSELGFGVISTQKTPFDALATQKATEDDTVITNMERNRNPRTLKKMAITLNDLSLITGSNSVFILNNDKIKESLDGIPVVKSWEMNEIETPAEFIKIIKERKQ
jgi:putative transcriptional regulator